MWPTQYSIVTLNYFNASYKTYARAGCPRSVLNENKRWMADRLRIMGPLKMLRRPLSPLLNRLPTITYNPLSGIHVARFSVGRLSVSYHSARLLWP